MKLLDSLKAYTVWIVKGAFLAAIIGFGLSSWLSPYDDTDPEGSRSGLVLRTDHLTGCQYLTTTQGGITPRLDRNNNHVGCTP